MALYNAEFGALHAADGGTFHLLDGISAKWGNDDDVRYSGKIVERLINHGLLNLESKIVSGRAVSFAVLTATGRWVLSRRRRLSSAIFADLSIGSPRQISIPSPELVAMSSLFGLAFRPRKRPIEQF